MKRPSPPSLAASAAALAIVAACGNEPRGPAVVPSLLSDPDRHAVHVGLADPSSPEGALGQVTAARVTEGGRVVVLDFVPPFVKVFERDGRLRAAFLRAGDGPGEARRPAAVAVSGDSLLLVADGGRGVSLFTLDGALRGHANVPGLMALSAAQPCPGEWLVYGPRVLGNDARSHDVRWLHRVRFTGASEAQVTSLFSGPLPATISGGLSYGMVAGEGGALVRHTMTGRPQLLRWDCGSGSARIVHTGETFARGEATPAEGGRRRTALVPGTRAPAGIAILPGGGVVLGELEYLGSHRDRTELALLDGGRERKVSFTGAWVIRDSRPGTGVLVSTNDPVPQVFLVRENDFLEMFPPP